MAFFCYICEEESTHICRRCTKDSCDNHLCDRCHRCSDCCECEVRLAEQPPHAAEAEAEAEPAAHAVGAALRATAGGTIEPDTGTETPPNGLPPDHAD